MPDEWLTSRAERAVPRLERGGLVAVRSDPMACGVAAEGGSSAEAMARATRRAPTNIRLAHPGGWDSWGHGQ